MSYNVPTYNTSRFSFGPGIVYIGLPGTTPLTEIGAVKGDAELLIQRVALEVKAGSPQSLIKSYAVEENVGLKFTGIEWNLNNLAFALGAGATSLVGAAEVFKFGGDIDKTSYAVRFVHRTPDGGTIDIHLFDGEGAADLAIALKETDIHEFPFEFKALEGQTDFEGSALASNEKKIKIVRTPI